MTASELQRQKALGKIIVIDVRSRREYRLGHLPGARHVPFWNLRQLRRINTAASGKTAVLYCEHGPRAWLARGFLYLQGHPSQVLQGHMQAWKASGSPLSKETGEG